MNPIIATEIVSRFVVWVFIFSIEVIQTGTFSSIQPHRYYPFGIVFATSIFIMLLWFKDSELIWDVRELVFYEILVWWIGYVLFLLHVGTAFFAISTSTIVFLRITRILWPIRKPDDGELATWPVFGPIGLWRIWKGDENKIKAKSAYQKHHDKYIYLLIASSILFWIVDYLFLGFSFKIEYVALSIAWLITLFYNRFISYLYQQNASHIATVKDLAVQKATAKANAALITASIQREQMLRELAEKNLELQEANKQREAMLEDLAGRNEILRDASHDLAQPLMGISYYARKLTEAQTQEEHDVFGEKLLTAVAGLGNLIDDTIHNAKITTKLEAPQLAPVSVEHLADQLWAQYLNAAHRKGIGFTLYKGTLSVPVDPHDPKRGHRSALDFHIATDENIIWRIISNLVINAINHTEQGQILVAFRRRGKSCWIEVRDSGSGIEHANGPDWEANFQHFAESIKRRYGTFKKGAGHGLGINNVKQLCNTIDTHMMLHSQPGRGSIFRFVVPLICPLDTPDASENSDSAGTLS